MAYPPLLELPGEAEYRAHFEATYCRGPIRAFDGIEVRFRKRDFDHCCFESSRRDGAKDAFSQPRAKRYARRAGETVNRGYDQKGAEMDIKKTADSPGWLSGGLCRFCCHWQRTP